MIISKTPFRISFFGGGTDYPAWYEENGGAVLSTSIDKYCYISLRYLPPFFEHRHRIVYSITETVSSIDEIKHPVVKALLELFEIERGIELHHDGDLPARAGLGSSSAFTVGMLNALYALNGKIISKQDLAKEAIRVERDILKENVGSQDQIAVAHGGLNRIEFRPDHTFCAEAVTVGRQRISELQEHLMLVYTGLSRYASEIAGDQIKNIKSNGHELGNMRHMVDQAVEILNGGNDITEFGRLLHKAWQIKKRLSQKISNPKIDQVYETAMKSGALGGKLLGAGGGGFMLFFVRPQDRENIRTALKDLLEVKFSFDTDGSKIIHYNPQEVI
ncbi:MAG: kinase [Candidatus Margulisbacteria bacterium]|nr:kinase [Candidatus Margulisiibacteriota bacterium]